MLEILWKVCICILLCFVVPTILGKCLVVLCKIDNCFLMEIVYGWLFVLASFQIFAVPATFLKCSLTFLCIIYSVFLLLCCVISIAFLIHKSKHEVVCVQKKKNAAKWNLYIVIAVIFVVFQVAIAIMGMHTDTDDAYYLGTATTSIVTDTLYVYEPDNGLVYTEFPYRYVFSALTLVWAYLSKLSGIHPIILTHVIIPPVFILIFYVIMWDLAKKLFKENEKRCLFFLFINIFQIFGFTSVYTQSAFLVLRIWQGKAMLPNIIFPVLIRMFLELNQKNSRKILWGIVFICVMAGCCASSMGVPLCMLSVGVGTIVLLLSRRRWQDLFMGALCCSPCILIGLAFLVLR